MNDINEMPLVCAYCPYWEVCKPPYICPDIGDKKPKRTEERTETHACDLISRAMLLEYIHNEPVGKMLCDKYNLDGVIKQLPSAQPEIIRCRECKYAEVADKEDSQDGYTCQFHRGSIWFGGSYCSWAERREVSE